MKLYEFAILHHPSPVKDSNGNETKPPSKVLVPPTTLLANGEERALLLAARSIPQDLIDNNQIGEVEVLLRPFA